MYMPKLITGLLLGIILYGNASFAQSVGNDVRTPGGSVDSTVTRLVNFPTKFLSRLQDKTADLDRRLTQQTEKYLQRMARQEARIRKELAKTDTAAARRLFGNSAQQYAALAQQMRSDTGGNARAISGEYMATLDSERVSLSFLQQNPQLLGAAGGAGLQSSLAQLQQLQAKMQDAGQVQDFVQQRKEEIRQYLSRYTQLPPGLNSGYQALNEQLYYYTQQVEQYKQMLNDPDKLEKKALSVLGQTPAFQQFMKNNSQLAMLFGTPVNYGTPQALAGLQTRDQVSQLIQNQFSSGGPDGMAILQQNIQTAQSQLDQYKDKLSSLGAGGGNVDIPDFRPNNQRTKTFLQRLEFGTNMQTTQANNYFPTTTDLGLSVGYRLNKNNTVGVGASYKIGWGSGFNHIAFSSQGAGLRSFLDIKLKGSFSATGGLEYNYATSFTSLQQIHVLRNWSQSGLVGVSKTVSLKSRVFKKTQLQVLWDFLSYQQVPKTQPILFRVGYNF
jgi:hypothetical protein